MNTTEKAHEWHPITDLPDNWRDLRRSDLTVVHRQWKEEKQILRDPVKIQKLQARLNTEWAIETGIIERLYTLDRGITETLIELGLEALDQFHENNAVPQPVADLLADQHAALEFVFQFVKQDRELTLSYIKELHQMLTRHQDFTEAVDQFGNKVMAPLLKGSWKLRPNNPQRPDGRLHEYCPPDFVQDEMDQLLRWHAQHEKDGVDVEIESAWLHHRFTQIHPFQDGNGRVARALATMEFLRDDFLPLVVRDEQHGGPYLDALFSADKGDLSALIQLFADIQLEDLTNAIATVRELRGEGIARIAASAAERVKLRQEVTEEEARHLTEELREIARVRLDEAKGELELTFAKLNLRIDATVFESYEANSTWWNRPIVDVARIHNYWADLSRFRMWVQLRLRLPQLGPTQSNLVITFHHRGTVPGLMVVNAFLSVSSEQTVDQEGGDIEGSTLDFETISVAERPFSYSAGFRDPGEAFRKWLEEVIEIALDKWQSRI